LSYARNAPILTRAAGLSIPENPTYPSYEMDEWKR